MAYEGKNKRGELVGAAEKLFSEKGFMATSIDDICNEVGVAHGLFYYYFDTKEDIIGDITERMIGELEGRLSDITEDPDLRADEKFLKFMNTAFQRKKNRSYLVSYFSKDNDPKIYYKLLNKTIELITPYISQIVKQGINEGIFDTNYPKQTIEFWLHGRVFLMDEDGYLDERLFQDLLAEAYMIERLLGAEEPFLTRFYKRYEEDIMRLIGDMKEDKT